MGKRCSAQKWVSMHHIVNGHALSRSVCVTEFFGPERRCDFPVRPGVYGSLRFAAEWGDPGAVCYCRPSDRVRRWVIMRSRILFALLLFGGPVFGEATFRLSGPTTLEVRWPGESGKQYGLFCSLDLENWTQITEAIPGIDGTMSAEDEISGAPRKFYRVEELGGSALDLARFKLGTIGNKWTYDVVSNSILGNEVYTWETQILQRTTFASQNVVEWEFKRGGVWDQSIYILDDFSTGIFEVGGENLDGVQTNSPPSPSMFASFMPGVGVPTNYTSSEIGPVTQTTTITMESDPLTVGAGTFTDLIKVTHEYTAETLGVQISGTTTEWFKLDIGLVKHIGVLDILGSTSTTTFTLASFDVD